MPIRGVVLLRLKVGFIEEPLSMWRWTFGFKSPCSLLLLLLTQNNTSTPYYTIWHLKVSQRSETSKSEYMLRNENKLTCSRASYVMDNNYFIAGTQKAKLRENKLMKRSILLMFKCDWTRNDTYMSNSLAFFKLISNPCRYENSVESNPYHVYCCLNKFKE